MHQVLFRIPLNPFGWFPDGIPIYGFGVMLFVAFFFCTWLAGRRAAREGIRKEFIQDLAMWLLFGGIAGARLTFLRVEEKLPWSQVPGQFLRIWDGGLVLYGSILGALAGYVLAYFFLVRRYRLSSWQLADIIAPSLAAGICLGRIGCFLNGCCFGAVACPDCPQVHYPLSGPARFTLVQAGYQTAAGFTLREQPGDGPGAAATVGEVDPASAAAASGLEPGDRIVEADGHPITSGGDLEAYLVHEWPRGKNDLTLTVQRGDSQVVVGPFAPRTLGLHPTQLYESVAMALVVFLLLAYEPFRRRPGQVMAVLMFCYGLERLLDEMLRADPRPIGFERYASVFLIVAGPVLWVVLQFLPLPARRVAVPAARA